MIISSHRSLSQTHCEKELGDLTARALSGVWRKSFPSEEPSHETLSLTTPLLYATGTAALGWWRIRNSELADSAGGGQLHDAYRRSRLNALIHEQELKHILSLLRTAGIEPILVKGWAIARRYPDRALRPYGDFDLCIRPDQFAQAESALKCLESIDGYFVDLHDGFTKLSGPNTQRNVVREARRGQAAHATALWDELCERSQLVDLGDEKIRVLSDEDHLRVLCLHLLRSGAWRPVWLCDVALVVETVGSSFDWDICLGTDRRQADWIACAIGLAHHLLGATLNDIPVADRARQLPRWLVPAVLRQWGRCRNPDAAGMAVPALTRSLTEPKELFGQIHARWDNPVRSAAALSGPFTNWSRLPYQLAELITHSPEVPKQLGAMLVKRWQRSEPLAFGTEGAISQLSRPVI